MSDADVHSLATPIPASRTGAALLHVRADHRRLPDGVAPALAPMPERIAAIRAEASAAVGAARAMRGRRG